MTSSLGGPTLTCTKICTVCRVEKSLDLFYNRKASDDGKAYRCKECDNKAVREFRKRHESRYREQARATQLKLKYGLSQEDFDSMLESQGYACKICKSDIERTISQSHTEKTLVVDHDHKTGVVRGLLCSKCNRGLGHFKDDISLLTGAINYLRCADAEVH